MDTISFSFSLKPICKGISVCKFVVFTLSVIVLPGLILSNTAQAQILNPRQIFASNETCPGDYGGKPKFNCTANDIDLALVTTTGGPADCDPGEMVSADFAIDLSANANIRYNAMIWISQNVVDPRTTGEGGVCFVSSVPDDDTTHIAELLFDDANVCADIDVPSNNFLLGGLEFGTIQFECADSDSNGFADIPVLVTWANKGGDACSAETSPDAGDGVYPINSTPAKCDTDLINTSIQVNTPDSGLQLDKTSTTANYNSIGDTINYEFVVTNTGDSTLTCPIEIDDDKTTNENCPGVCDSDDTTSNLEPGESVTCTASHNVIQDDLDSGFVQNFATARSSDQPPVVSNQDSVTVNGIFTVINLVKDLTNDGGGTASEGDFDLVLTGDDGTHTSGLPYNDPDGNGVSVNVEAGVEYSVSEPQVPNYDLTGILCLDDDGLSDVGTTFTLSEGQSVTCTFSNDDIDDNFPGPGPGPGNGEPAIFRIEKIWNQAGDTDGLQVTAHLSCTGAVSTQQNVVFTATTDAILFVYDIASIPEGGQVDCTVTEDVPENYAARYRCDEENCGDSQQRLRACFWPDVQAGGNYMCTITNRPLPAVVTVTKTWVIEGADQGFDGGHFIVGVCDSVITGPTGDRGCFLGSCFAAVREDDASAGSTDYEFTIVRPNYPFSRCDFFEDSDDSIVESDNGCGRLRLGAGDDVDCEIVNTVFFEGIPTLNQYGMAILALLMLGVGFIGFRRFI